MVAEAGEFAGLAGEAGAGGGVVGDAAAEEVAEVGLDGVGFGEQAHSLPSNIRAITSRFIWAASAARV